MLLHIKYKTDDLAFFTLCRALFNLYDGCRQILCKIVVLHQKYSKGTCFKDVNTHIRIQTACKKKRNSCMLIYFLHKIKTRIFANRLNSSLMSVFFCIFAVYSKHFVSSKTKNMRKLLQE